MQDNLHAESLNGLDILIKKLLRNILQTYSKIPGAYRSTDVLASSD